MGIYEKIGYIKVESIRLGGDMNTRDKLIKSEIIEMFDTTKEALRHYEKVGLLEPEKDEKKYRFYGFKEMEKLRQIFVLKDLGFQLDEMKLIMNKDVSQEAFARLLTKHNDLLKKRIDRYKDIQDNISMVLRLLESQTHSMTFSLKELNQRTFLMLDSKEIINDNPKEYYDRFKKFIQEEYYNERVLVSCYNYNLLDSFETNYSKLCFDIGDHHNDLLENDDAVIKVYQAGVYLSVFYVFKHGEKSDLGELKRHIDRYISSNNLLIEDEEVLEFEHPELGMLLKPGEDLYEIQVKVRYEHG